MRALEDDSGWAGRSVSDAMLHAAVLGVGGTQVVLMWALAVSPSRGPLELLLLAHAAFALLTLTVLVRPLPLWCYLVPLYALLLFDLAAAAEPDGALACAAVWLTMVATATPVLLLTERRAVLVSAIASVAIAGSVTQTHPEWGSSVPLVIIAMAPGMVLAAFSIIRPLRRLAARADRQTAAAAAAQQEVLAARARGDHVAEHARVMHDTVVNTLAALAEGAAVQGGRTLVRRRCALDVRLIQQMRTVADGTMPGLRSAVEAIAPGVRWSGVSEARLGELEGELPDRTRHALRGAVTELVRNAVKHSGAREIRVGVAAPDGRLQVVVSDDGAGFDPASAGWGLTESVIGRSRDAGIDVELDTARRRGTRATLVVGDPERRQDTQAAADAVIRRISRSACWAWAAALTGTGLFAEVLLRPGSPTSGLAAPLLVGVMCLVAAATVRDGRPLPGAVAVLVVLAIPSAFLLGFAGVGHGHELVHLWHPIGLTPLLVVLLVTGRSPVPLLCAVAGLVAVGFVSGGYHEGGSRVGAVVLVNVAVQLAQFAGWVVFQRMLALIGRRCATDQERAAHDRAEADGRAALEQSMEQWAAAGADDALEVLERIAAGDLDPADPAVRRRCGEEERYLRQLMLLSPNLMHLNDWFVEALGEARRRSVDLTLRTSDIDLPPRTADAFGQLVLDTVRAAAPGQALTVGLFGATAPTLFLVGPRDLSVPSVTGRRLGHQWSVRHRVLGGHTLTEVAAQGADVAGHRSGQEQSRSFASNRCPSAVGKLRGASEVPQQGTPVHQFPG